MTLRAVLLGLLGGAVFCGFTYFNDSVMLQTMLIGNHMPVSAYGGLLLFVLAANPVLFWLHRRLALSGRELAVVLALTLVACCIPGSGLLRTFTTNLMMPQHYARTQPGWSEQGLLEMLPEVMLPETADEKVINGFVSGMRKGTRHIGLDQVPWSAWRDSLGFWLILILSLWVGLIGLALVVHRQWSDHEQLPYPVARFADSLLPGQGGMWGEVLGSRLFWLGLCAVAAIHLYNYAAFWSPAHLVPIQLQVDIRSLADLFPTFKLGLGGFGGPYLVTPHLYFIVIGFAYLLATDVSLSLGIGPYLWPWVLGLTAASGYSLAGGGYLSLQAVTFLNFGAYVGLFLVLIYTGRHYYSHVFRRALLLPSAQAVESHSVWGARVFLACLAAFVTMLAAAGLDWPLAFLYAAGAVVIYLVMGRIIAETGMFFIQAYCFPCVILWGVFGAVALGPQALLILLVLTAVLLADPRETLMPFAINSLKIVDLRRVSVGRTAGLAVVALVVGLAIAVPTTLYFQYDRGANMADAWATRADQLPGMPYKEVLNVKHRLAAQGVLERSEAVSGWSRFAEMAPGWRYVAVFGVGMALVLVMTAGRLRVARWPLHPVMFLVWNSYGACNFAFSFLVGWFIKSAITRYGGAAVYQKVKPLMFGLIAGELLGGFVPVIIGAICYLVTGEPPRRFFVLPL